MKKRRFLKNNKGYSLIELIIVIGIIALLTGAAMVTLTLINSAKCKEAATTFEAEVSTLAAKSKNQVCKMYDPGTGTYVETTDYVYAIRIYEDSNGKNYIQNGYYKASDAWNGEFVSFAEENKNDGKGIYLTNKIYIRYDKEFKSSYSASKGLKDWTYNSTSSSDTGVVIAFNRDGSMLSGYGDYYFIKNNSKKNSSNPNIVATVSLKVNGGSQSY